MQKPPLITKRTIQIVLGLLWIIDGLMQLQHTMFTSRFNTDVIAPAASGQPAIVAGGMHFLGHIFLLNPLLFNSLIVLVQVGIGLLILYKRTIKLGLAASIVWGLFIWYAGEGLGGLGSGQTLLLMGAPGAALLYSIISTGVIPHKKSTERPAYWLAYAWAVIWLGGALLQLVSNHNTTADLAMMIRDMASGAPSWLANIDLNVANYLQTTGQWFIFLLVALQALIGFCVFLPSRFWRNTAIWSGILLSIIFWVVGQALGSYFSGTATDPNTGPLLVLLGLAVLGSENTVGEYIASVI